MSNEKHPVEMTADERALHWIRSGLQWGDYCLKYSIGSFGDTAKAQRTFPVRDSRTMPRLHNLGLVKIVGGHYVAV